MNSDKAAAGSPKPDEGHGQPTVEVTVNEQKVNIQKPQDSKTTGAAIKAAAIAQGVAIQPNFVPPRRTAERHEPNRG